MKLAQITAILTATVAILITTSCATPPNPHEPQPVHEGPSRLSNAAEAYNNGGLLGSIGALFSD
jgi:hypothetical protein